MPDSALTYGPVSWQRMSDGIEKVKDRMRRTIARKGKTCTNPFKLAALPQKPYSILMIIEPLPPEAPPQLRISCERYHAMIEKGLLTEEDRIELINGYLLTKMSISPTHSGTVNRLLRLLMTLLGERVIVAVQNPITIHEFSEPEPDLVVAKFRDDYYADGHPTPEDILFVVEVADSSLAFDRDTKIPLYAASGIAESWLVDLNAREITVFSQPEGANYTRTVRFSGEDVFEISGFAGAEVSVADVGV